MRIREVMKLSEAIPNEQIFYYMTSLSFIPSASTASYLDTEYFFNRSGSKQASPLVERLANAPELEDDEVASRLAAIIVNRYSPKWEAYFREFAGMATLNLLDNLSVSTSTEHGKTTTRTESDTSVSTGTESSVTGKNAASSRVDTESIDSDNPRTSTRTLTGGYTDSGSSVNTRTGSQKVTDTGNLLSSTYGFNSTDPVPANLSGPATETGTSTETTFGAEGLKDSETTGNVRKYTDYKDVTTESGRRDNMSVVSSADDTSVTGNSTKTDTRTLSSTDANSGTDTVTQAGRKYDNPIDVYMTLFKSAAFIDFLEVVFADCDEVLTCPYYV